MLRRLIHSVPFSVAIMCMASMASPVLAATITSNVSTGVSTPTGSGPLVSDGGAQTTTGLSVSRSANAALAGTASAGAASVDIDLSTGVFKFGAYGSSGLPPASIATSTVTNSAASWTIEETFTATGSGQATFTNIFDGLIATSPLGFGKSIIAGATFDMALRNLTKQTFVMDSALLNTAIDGSNNISVDSEMSLTLDADAGDTLELEFRGSAGIFANSRIAEVVTASSDFTNTAILGLSTTGTLGLTASDPGFLSNTGGGGTVVSPVPLPAGMTLMLAGLGAFGIAARRRRQIA